MQYKQQMGEILNDVARIMTDEVAMRTRVMCLVSEAMDLCSAGKLADAIAVLDTAHELLSSSE